MVAPLDPAPHQSCFLQRLDVLRCRRERHAEWARKLADTALCKRQAVQHRPPRGVGESVEHGVESLGLMFNHEVEYTGLEMMSTEWLNNSSAFWRLNPASCYEGEARCRPRRPRTGSWRRRR